MGPINRGDEDRVLLDQRHHAGDVLRGRGFARHPSGCTAMPASPRIIVRPAATISVASATPDSMACATCNATSLSLHETSGTFGQPQLMNTVDRYAVAAAIRMCSGLRGFRFNTLEEAAAARQKAKQDRWAGREITLSSVRNRQGGKIIGSNTSGVTGVHRTKRGTYRAYIGNSEYLGVFKTIEEAAAARKQAEQIQRRTA